MGKSISSLNKSRCHKATKENYFILESDNNDNKDNMKEPLKYYLPNFIKDTDLMVMIHFLGRYLFQSIHSAPIEEKLANEHCKVLDVG